MKKELHRTISLTFDESPLVRIQAAKELATIDDPAAIFALMELSYDKDPSVRNSALEVLDKRKTSEVEVMSFAKIFGPHEPETGKQQTPLERKERMLQPITQLFEKHLGKERAQVVKQRMMPTIERIYNKTKPPLTPKEDIHETGKREMQEFLTSYLEAISEINDPPEQVITPPQIVKTETVQSHLELDEVSAKEPELEQISIDAEELKHVEDEELHEEERIEKWQETPFKKAYEMMMLSGGDHDIMKQEAQRVVAEFEKDVKLAFNLAKRKFKEQNITHLTKLRDGMNNVNTELLKVKDVSTLEYTKGRSKKKENATRALVTDEEGNEGVV